MKFTSEFTTAAIYEKWVTFSILNNMERRVWWAVIIFFVIFSLWPTWYEINRRDDIRPNRYFELIHNFPTDYNFYLSRIREGIEGRLTVVEKYTSEPHQGSFIHILYLAMGWAGAWNRVPWERAGDVYHMGRIVLAVLLLALTAELARYCFKQFWWAMLAFFLAVSASTWPKIVTEWDGWRFGGYMPWWSVMDSLQRITFLPHLLFGQSLILFLLIALSDRETIRKPGNWIFLGILGFVMGIVFPPGILFVDFTLFVFVVIEIYYDLRILRRMKQAKIISWAIDHVFPRLAFVLLSAPSLLYLSLMTSFYPWKRLAELDVIQPLPFKYGEYFLAVGPVLPVGIIGLILVLLKKDRKMLINASWIISWGLLLLIFNFIPQQSPLRFSEMTPHIPLGMLTAYLFYKLFLLFEERSGLTFFRDVRFIYKEAGYNSQTSLSETSLTSVLTRAKVFLGRSFNALQKANPLTLLFVLSAIIAPVFLVILFMGIMQSSWKWQRDFVDHKIRAEFPLVPTGSYVMYPLKDFIAGMKFIQDASKRSDVILSETTAGNYMPVYSGNTVYVGHDNTVNATEKKALAAAFFQSRMNPDDAKTWFAREKFRYVYYGPQEKEENNWLKDLSKVYPFLRQAYANDYVTVYEPVL